MSKEQLQRLEREEIQASWELYRKYVYEKYGIVLPN